MSEPEKMCLQLDRIEHAIEQRIIPLLEKHEKAIWGQDGNNGLVGGLREAKTKISFLEKFLFMVAGAAVTGLATAVFAVITNYKN